MPNHDQLVSAAEHGHHHGRSHNIEKYNSEKNDANGRPRSDLSDLWSSSDNHEKHKQPDSEMQHRLDQIFNGWQDPYNKNGKSTNVAGANISERQPSTNNDGLIGQLVTLVNDLIRTRNRNKRQRFI